MTITDVKLIEHLQDELDLCELVFDGGADSAYIIWNFTNLMEYNGGEAVVTFRQDIYKGAVHKFVNTLARVGVIKTLEKEDNIKLYTSTVDNHSNVSFKDVAEGATVQKAVLYVTDTRVDSSARAIWCDFKCLDRERRTATVRLFNPSSSDESYKGRYIMCDLRRSAYGFSTDAVTTIDTAFEHSPEVSVAEKFIVDTFSDDQETLAVLQQSAFIQFCKRNVAEEPGYELVRLAIELDLCNETANLVQATDFKLIKKALLYSHFTVLNSESVFDPTIVGYASISKFRFDSKRAVLELLYSDTTSYAKERAMYTAIKDAADAAVKVKKGVW